MISPRVQTFLNITTLVILVLILFELFMTRFSIGYSNSQAASRQNIDSIQKYDAAYGGGGGGYGTGGGMNAYYIEHSYWWRWGNPSLHWAVWVR